MKVRAHGIALLLLLLSLQACTTTVNPSNLYWGNYSNTLHMVKKEPGAASTLEHKTELESIIEEAKNRDAKVPPGLHAELGFLYFNAGDAAQATAQYKTEAELYPESRKLMNILIEDAGKTVSSSKTDKEGEQ